MYQLNNNVDIYFIKITPFYLIKISPFLVQKIFEINTQLWVNAFSGFLSQKLQELLVISNLSLI